MRTPEEIKKRIKCFLKMCENTCNMVCGICEAYEAGYSLSASCSDALSYIQQLESRLAQTERERDAAVSDCSRFPCATCSDKENGDLCHNCNVCKDTTRTNYVWRGVCPENTKEE